MNTYSRPFMKTPWSIFCLQGIRKQRSHVTYGTPYPRQFARAHISATARGTSFVMKLRLPSKIKNPDIMRFLGDLMPMSFLMASGNYMKRSRGQNSDSGAHTRSVHWGDNGSVIAVTQEVWITRDPLVGALGSKDHALPFRDHSGHLEEERVYPQTGTSL